MLLLLLTPTASEPSAGFDVVVDDASPCAVVDGPAARGGAKRGKPRELEHKLVDVDTP